MRDRTFYAFKFSLEKNRRKCICEALTIRDRLFTILNFSLEKTWGSTITLFITLRVCEALAMRDRLFSTFIFSLEKNRRKCDHPVYDLHNFP
jgi:hypothetical protein